MADWVKVDGLWKHNHAAEVNEDDEWYQQLLRDANEIEEHLDRVTSVSSQTLLTLVPGVAEYIDFERCSDDEDIICAEPQSTTTSSSSEIVIGEHFQRVEETSTMSSVPPTRSIESSDQDSTRCLLRKLEDQQVLLMKEVGELKERLDQSDAYMDDQYSYIEYLEKKLNNLDQYGRRENIEISGIPNNVPNDILEEEVLKILRKIGLVNISSYDIVGCHRLGSRDRFGTRNVIVRFVNRKDATFSLKARKHLHKCSELGYHHLRVAENLCPAYRSIYDKLSVEKDKGNIKEFWSYNGIVNCKLTDNGTPKKLYFEHDIDSLWRGGGRDE